MNTAAISRRALLGGAAAAAVPIAARADGRAPAAVSQIGILRAEFDRRAGDEAEATSPIHLLAQTSLLFDVACDDDRENLRHMAGWCNIIDGLQYSLVTELRDALLEKSES